MNTLLYIWLDPIDVYFERAKGKVYFNYIIEKDLTNFSMDELGKFIGSGSRTSIVRELMEYANISRNMDFGVISAIPTTEKHSISITISPEEQKAISLKKEIDILNEQIKKEKEKLEQKEQKFYEKNLKKVIDGKLSIKLTRKNLEIKDDGTIDLNFPALKIKDNINFPKLWDQLEKHIIGKIKKDDELEILDDNGDIVLSIHGGNYLNVGLAELKVYDSNKMPEKMTIFNDMQGLKGGLFIRNDGSLDIGNTERTFWLRIDTKRLLRLSLKSKQSLTEITSQKLLEQQNKKNG